MKQVVIGFIILLVLAAGYLFYSRTPTEVATVSGPKGLPTKGGESLNIKIKVPYFSQADPLWKDATLGESGDTMAGYGCTVCSAAMALHAIGRSCTPQTLNSYLSDNSGFTQNGLLIWEGLRKYAGDYSIVLKDQTTHVYIDTQLKQGIPIIAKVLWQGRVWHWVLITGKQNDQYLIADPLVPNSPHITAVNYPEGFFSIRHLKPN